MHFLSTLVNREMRITFVLPNAGLAGGTRVVAVYAERLLRRGHQVQVVSTPLAGIPLRRQAKSLLTGRGWLRRPSGPSHLDGLVVPHHVINRRRPVIDSDVPDADVVVATWWETAEWVAALSAEKGAKVYFLQHYEVWGSNPKDRVDATWRLPMHKITIASWLVDTAASFGDSRVDLVPNSVDLQLFNAPRREKHKTPTVGFMYSSLHYKGADIILAAIGRARRSLPALRVIAFGAEATRPSLPLPPRSTYVLQPAQQKLKRIYASCDAWLFGSRFEGFGLPILEAMACRTPVIGTPTGAAPDLLRTNSGILIRPEDPSQMSAAILDVARMPSTQWRLMSETAYATATRYNWDDATVLFEGALCRAIERAKRGEVAGGPAGRQAGLVSEGDARK